jgi:hypothetical protein
MGGKRGGSAGLSDRHGVGGNSWQRPRTHSSSPYAYVWPADAVLFHSGRLVRVDPGAGVRAACLHSLLLRQVDFEVRRRLSDDQNLRLPAKGRSVYDPLNVNRIDVWNDISALRLVARDHHSSGVFLHRGDSHRQCRCAYRYCERFLPASPFIAYDRS